jgi:SAM-dependent methyltransferase
MWQREWERYSVGDKVRALENHSDVKTILSKYIDDDGQVLEAGCGLGGWLHYISSSGRHVVGIDFIHTCLEKLKKELTKACVATSDVACLPFKSGSFTYVVSFGVLEHLEDNLEEALDELVRVTKDGGVLFLSVPYRSLVFWRYRVRNLRRRGGNPEGHFFQYFITRREFRSIMENRNLQILEHVPYGNEITLFYNFGIFRKDREKWNYEINTCGRVFNNVISSVNKWILGNMQLVIARKSSTSRGLPGKTAQKQPSP